MKITQATLCKEPRAMLDTWGHSMNIWEWMKGKIEFKWRNHEILQGGDSIWIGPSKLGRVSVNEGQRWVQDGPSLGTFWGRHSCSGYSMASEMPWGDKKKPAPRGLYYGWWSSEKYLLRTYYWPDSVPGGCTYYFLPTCKRNSVLERLSDLLRACCIVLSHAG